MRNCTARSKTLEIFEQVFFLLRWQAGAVEMSHAAVAFRRRVETKAVLLRVGPTPYKAGIRVVVNVVAPPEDFGPLLRGFQQVAQSRYATVVQVGGPKPDAIERHGGVAVSLAKMREFPRPP